MANGTIPKTIFYSSYSATTGTTQYQGYYYADVSLSDYLSDNIPVAYAVTDATSNRPAFVTRVGNSLRVWATAASTKVDVRVLWLKG